MSKELAKPIEIKDLQINPTKRLTTDMKKAFVRIIEDEFANQETIVKKDFNDVRGKAILEYRKKYNLDAKLKDIEDLEMKLAGVKALLEKYGLTPRGELKSYGSDDANQQFRTFEVSLKELEQKYSVPRTNKNKIISRMWMAENQAEASVILREVMGNGIIPTITELPAIEYSDNGSK